VRRADRIERAAHGEEHHERRDQRGEHEREGAGGEHGLAGASGGGGAGAGGGVIASLGSDIGIPLGDGAGCARLR
jgi:hypothetical protein